MYAGSDIEKALTEAQQKNKIKSNIFVTGYENGEETSVDVHIEDECGLEE